MDHATDMIVEVDAPNMQEAFVDAAMSVTDTMVNVSKVTKSDSVQLSASGSDMRHLLYSWLEEIIYKTITEGFAIAEIKITNLDQTKYSLDAIAYGESIDLKKHGFKLEIKAPTFYQMHISEKNEKTSMRFLLDL